jgi:hypothetical protein
MSMAWLQLELGVYHRWRRDRLHRRMVKHEMLSYGYFIAASAEYHIRLERLETKIKNRRQSAETETP